MLELMVVVIIVGVIAGLSIPSFQRNMERTVERTAADNLNILWAAIRLKAAQEGAMPTTAYWGADDINPAFNVYLIEDPDYISSYRCGVDIPTGAYDCDAVSTFGWILHVMENHESEKAHCSAGPQCPTCQPYCPF